jgi:anthranilate phosphoribosyltransferase
LNQWLSVDYFFFNILHGLQTTMVQAITMMSTAAMMVVHRAAPGLKNGRNIASKIITESAVKSMFAHVIFSPLPILLLEH